MLLASDLDGTLELQEGHLSPSVKKTLHLAGERGITRALITGRNYHSLMQVLRKEDPLDYLCISSGAGILSWPDQNWLKRVEFPPEVFQQICPFLQQRGHSFFALDHIPENHRGYASAGSAAPEDFFRRKERYLPWETADISSHLSQFIVILPDVGSRNQLIKELEKEGFPITMIHVTSPFDRKTPWLELFPAGVHKGAALDYLSEVLGIPLKETAALGNDWNDLHMLEQAGQGWVVPRSPEGLRNLFPVAPGDPPLAHVVDCLT